MAIECSPTAARSASPVRNLLMVASLVFLAEVGIMVLLSRLPPFPAWQEVLLDSAMLVVLVFPVLQRFMVRPLVLRIREREQAEKELLRAKDQLEHAAAERSRVDETVQEANRELVETVAELESRSREIEILSELGGLFQTSLRSDEAFSVIGQYGQKLFPGDAGAFSLLNPSGNHLEEVAAWGKMVHSERAFAPADCWALRMGRIHGVGAGDPDPACSHVPDQDALSYLCVLLFAQGEAMGLLHLRFGATEGRPEGGRRGLCEANLRLAAAFGESVALGLANLKLRERLQVQAIRDPLTGLFNRRYMDEALERELARADRKGAPVGVIMADLDHFKRFNDGFSHDAGDALLKEVGRVLQQNIRRGDIACRYGGDEFAIILPEASLEATLRRAEQLRGLVHRLRNQNGGQALEPISISLGIAVFPTHGKSARCVLRAADAALYAAKTAGRNRSEICRALLDG